MTPVLSAQDWFLAVDSQNHTKIREGLRRFAGIKDELGDTALMHAARSGDLVAVKILVSHEQGLINSAHQTALMQAILQERVTVVRFLRPYEGHINTNDNRTPFMVAASAGCVQSLAALTHHFDLSTNLNGLTALDYAVLGNNLECTRIIIETQNVTLDQIDYALNLSEEQRNKEVSMYLLSVRQYIKNKIQGRGASGKKQLFCIPSDELQQMGTALDKVVRTRVESARRPTSAKGSLTVQLPHGKALGLSSSSSQAALEQPLGLALGSSSLVHKLSTGAGLPAKPGLGRSDAAARSLPGVVPSSALNTYLSNQSHSSANVSLIGSSSGGKKSSRPSSARAASRPSSAQKSHSVHRKAKEPKERKSSSRSRRDSSHAKDNQDKDVVSLITSLNKELGLKVFENIQLQNENRELKNMIAALKSEGKSSDEMNSQLEALKKQLERQDRIIVELEAADHDNPSKDFMKQQCLAMHAKVVSISQLLLSKDAELAKLRSMVSDTAALQASATDADATAKGNEKPGDKPDSTMIAEDLLMMSASLLQNFGADPNGSILFLDNTSDDAATAKSMAFVNALMPNVIQRNEQLTVLTAENQDLKTRCIELLELLTAAQSEVARLSSLQADNEATQISELVDMKNSQIGELKKRNEALENTTLETQTLYNELKEKYMLEVAEHTTLRKAHEAVVHELEEAKKVLAGKNTTINSLIKRMTALRAQADMHGNMFMNSSHGISGQADQILELMSCDASMVNDMGLADLNQSSRAATYSLLSRNKTSNMGASPESDAPSVFLNERNSSDATAKGSLLSDERQLSLSRPRDYTDSFLESPEQPTRNKMTPLMQAIVEGNARGVGANLRYLQETLPDGTTALMLAVQHGRQSFIKYLLEKEAGMQRSNGVTALQLAIEAGNTLAIAALEDYESPPLPEVSTNGGRHTELMQAVEDNRLLDTWSLSRIQAGLKDTLGRTALMFAAQRGNIQAVRLLVDKEAHIKDYNGLSALDYAKKCPDRAKQDSCMAALQKAISLRV